MTWTNARHSARRCTASRARARCGMRCAGRSSRSSPLRDGRISAYASSLTSGRWHHGVAESDEDMQALLLGAAAADRGANRLPGANAVGAVPLVPGKGLRLVKPMNLMARGAYQEPMAPVPLRRYLIAARTVEPLDLRFVESPLSPATITGRIRSSREAR